MLESVFLDYCCFSFYINCDFVYFGKVDDQIFIRWRGILVGVIIIMDCDVELEFCCKFDCWRNVGFVFR